MNTNLSVGVKNLSKSFKIPHERKMRVKDYFLSPFSKTTFKRFDVLKDINFEINKGEFVGIIGRNGSGKSTLLKLLAGVYEPDEGSVDIAGKLVPFLELGVGFNYELSGRENIFLNGSILGMTKKELKKKFDEIVKFAEIEEFIDSQLKHYSSGMVVRLAFAIAIQSKGDIFLLDEVLAVGDAGFQTKSLQEILRLKKQGKTIIYVSHDHGSIAKYSDKVVWIRDGNVEDIGVGYDEIDRVLRNYLMTFEQTPQQEEAKVSENIEVKIKITNKSNNSAKIYESGDPLNISVDYKVLNEAILNDLIFGISIQDETGTVVYGTNSSLKKAKIKNKEGNLTFHFDDLNLLAGSYYITIGIHDSAGQNFYWDENRYIFNVISKIGDVGIVPLHVTITQSK